MRPMSRDASDPRPLVLVADDDARVVELMRLALVQAHYRVLTALDGEDAVRQALAERPDAIVLEARLPRRSGLEVCEFLRHDPDDPHVPIVLLASPAETDARLEGLSRGADDVMGKPFSPRELVARLHRLLVRASEARTQRRRADTLERDLVRAQADSRRAHDGLTREHERRVLVEGLGRELQGLLDPDDVAERGLAAIRRRLGSRFSIQVAPTAPDGAWRACRALGTTLDRFESLVLAPDSALGRWLESHGRPVRIGERTRFRDLDVLLAPFVAAGCSLLVPLRGRHGLEGLVGAADRVDGGDWDTQTLDAIEAIASQLTPALRAAAGYRAQQVQALHGIADAGSVDEPSRRARREAESLAQAFLDHAHLPERETALLRHAVSLGALAWSGRTRASLDALAHEDRTSFLAELCTLIDDSASLELTAQAPERHRATLGTAVIVRHRHARQGGRSTFESWHSALAWVSAHLDPSTASALEQAWAAREGVAA